MSRGCVVFPMPILSAPIRRSQSRAPLSSTLRSNDWLPARFVFALPKGHRGLVVEDVANFRMAFERSLRPVRDIAEMAQQRAAVSIARLRSVVFAFCVAVAATAFADARPRRPARPATRQRPSALISLSISCSRYGRYAELNRHHRNFSTAFFRQTCARNFSTGPTCQSPS